MEIQYELETSTFLRGPLQDVCTKGAVIRSQLPAFLQNSAINRTTPPTICTAHMVRF